MFFGGSNTVTAPPPKTSNEYPAPWCCYSFGFLASRNLADKHGIADHVGLALLTLGAFRH